MSLLLASLVSLAGQLTSFLYCDKSEWFRKILITSHIFITYWTRAVQVVILLPYTLGWAWNSVLSRTLLSDQHVIQSPGASCPSSQWTAQQRKCIFRRFDRWEVAKVTFTYRTQTATPSVCFTADARCSMPGGAQAKYYNPVRMIGLRVEILTCDLSKTK
jgi:hypothetical protein